jgi:hypothetical protein
MKEIHNIDITIINGGSCRQDIQEGGKLLAVVVIAAQ